MSILKGPRTQIIIRALVPTIDNIEFGPQNPSIWVLGPLGDYWAVATEPEESGSSASTDLNFDYLKTS